MYMNMCESWSNDKSMSNSVLIQRKLHTPACNNTNRKQSYLKILPQDWSVIAQNGALRPSQDLFSDVVVLY